MPDRDVTGGLRPAEVGELCTCGRQAVDVYVGGEFGATGDCGRRDGGAPVDGVCPFCGDTIDHELYWRGERKAGRPAADGGNEPQGGRCPLYRLRLAAPLPAVHQDSVEPFDREADQQRRSEGRLRAELIALFSHLEADFDATYRLDLTDEPDGQPETGDLEDVVFDLCWATRQALSREEHDPAGHDPAAAQTAVAVLVSMLRPRLDELGVTPNPLDGLDARGLVDAAGGGGAWLETVAGDRPLLIVRRVVRRAVEPDAPSNIYRQWWT